MNKREQYLSEKWRRYPTLPSDDWSGGELVLLETGDGGGVVRLSRQGKFTEYSAALLRLVTVGKGAETENPAEVLIPGDKIAVRTLGDSLELALLSPCLKASPGHRLSPRAAVGWREFLKLVREYFEAENFIEVATPSLVVCPGTEPALDPLSVKVRTASGVLERYLPTSPELHLKKLLAQGWSRIFEIRSVFRDGETSPHHEVEFTMMEFYRAFEPLGAIVNDLSALISRLKAAGLVEGEMEEPRSVSIPDLFLRHFGFSLTPRTSPEELRALCAEHGIDKSPDDSWDDLFHRLWLAKIEPWLATLAYPVFVLNFPPSQASMARIGRDGWAERVELFWRGLEIANGFHELNDPDEQAKRFIQDLEEKRRLGKAPVTLDDEFMAALRSGMPPASGIAVGMERLFMAAQGIKRIQELKAFPYN